MSGKGNVFKEKDQELERMLREALAVSLEAAELSPRVTTAVMRRIRELPREEASLANTLAVWAAFITGAAFLGLKAWGGIIPGVSYLAAGQARHWGWDVLTYVLHSLWSAAKTILYLGLGEMFPLILAAVVLLGLLAPLRPGHSGSRA